MISSYCLDRTIKIDFTFWVQGKFQFWKFSDKLQYADPKMTGPSLIRPAIFESAYCKMLYFFQLIDRPEFCKFAFYLISHNNLKENGVESCTPPPIPRIHNPYSKFWQKYLSWICHNFLYVILFPLGNRITGNESIRHSME